MTTKISEQTSAIFVISAGRIGLTSCQECNFFLRWTNQRRGPFCELVSVCLFQERRKKVSASFILWSKSDHFRVQIEPKLCEKSDHCFRVSWGKPFEYGLLRKIIKKWQGLGIPCSIRWTTGADGVLPNSYHGRFLLPTNRKVKLNKEV